MTSILRQSLLAVRMLAVMTFLLGVLYPLGIWTIGRVVSPTANGSFVTDNTGRTVGSALIGQSFTGEQWFWPRPSAAGNGYQAQASGGSNLGPDEGRLADSIRRRKLAFATSNHASIEQVPADAVTASGSGVDPDITPRNAEAQVARVARLRHLPVALLRQLVATHTRGRILGFMGEPRVNVLELNLALEHLT